MAEVYEYTYDHSNNRDEVIFKEKSYKRVDKGDIQANKGSGKGFGVFAGILTGGVSFFLLFILLQIIMAFGTYTPGSVFDVNSYFHDLLSSVSQIRLSDWTTNQFDSIGEQFQKMVDNFNVTDSPTFISGVGDFFKAFGNFFGMFYYINLFAIGLLGNIFAIIGNIFKSVFTIIATNDYWIPVSDSFSDIYGFEWNVPVVPPLEL